MKLKINKESLKKIKKNEIIIYAIALMLVTAGYFNYSSNSNNEFLETYSESVNELSKIEENQDEKNSNIGDARLVDSKDIIKEDEKINETENENKENNSNEEEKENKENEYNEQNEEEADVEETNSDTYNYFVSTKLERNTNYAGMISNYTRILEDDNISETEKGIAMQEIKKINNIQNAISISENLLSTKGFNNSVILINEDSINVVVDMEGELTKENVAQIQNIISREMSANIENIHITKNQQK